MLIITVLTIVFGLLLRFWCERTEARQMLGISTFLAKAEETPGRLKPETLSTVIERLRTILATTKLVRFLSLGMVTTASLFLVKTLLQEEVGSTFTGVLVLTITAFLVLLLVTLVSRLGMPKRLTLEGALPYWLVDREEQIPIVFVVGNTIWERLYALIDPLARPFHLMRPMGFLFESEGLFRLALNRQAAELPSGANQNKVRVSTLQRSEAQMIHGIQRLDQTLVREIMKPINQVTAIRLQDFTPQRFLELCRVAGYTRIPCYYDHVTNLVGYINVYDVLELDEMPESLESLIAKPLFVPEVAHVDNVLQLMMNSKKQVAIVFDEFGGTSGWLSREDIVEEIVGEVEDELERPKNLITSKGDAYILDPLVDLDDLEEQVGLSLERENCDTLGGYIYYVLGRPPRRGEELDINGWKLRVTAVDDFRIRRLSLTPPKPAEEGTTGNQT
ncbi:MAG: transporter associated domain-containing protein [Candidatus Sumerlaeia bacterium]|nr:transporter associated domain-containing protein [Candidatus Sumerlaeia bacterium]